MLRKINTANAYTDYCSGEFFPVPIVGFNLIQTKITKSSIPTAVSVFVALCGALDRERAEYVEIPISTIAAMARVCYNTAWERLSDLEAINVITITRKRSQWHKNMLLPSRYSVVGLEKMVKL